MGDRGFESHPLRGEMLEWLNRHAWKACRVCKGSRGFESRSLRQFINDEEHTYGSVSYTHLTLPTKA